jgi:hypothetical protein
MTAKPGDVFEWDVPTGLFMEGMITVTVRLTVPTMKGWNGKPFTYAVESMYPAVAPEDVDKAQARLLDRSRPIFIKRLMEAGLTEQAAIAALEANPPAAEWVGYRRVE